VYREPPPVNRRGRPGRLPEPGSAHPLGVPPAAPNSRCWPAAGLPRWRGCTRPTAVRRPRRPPQTIASSPPAERGPPRV